MRKFLQEVIYWIALLFTYNYWKHKEFDMQFATFSLMVCIVLNFMFILFTIQYYTDITIGDYVGNFILANRDPSDRVAVQKYKLILFYATVLIFFSYIFYKIIFYKTNIKKIKKYYEDMPQKRKKKGLWFAGIYMTSSLILVFVFAALLAEEKQDSLHLKVAEQKVDTAIYFDRLPAEANLLLPPKNK